MPFLVTNISFSVICYHNLEIMHTSLKISGNPDRTCRRGRGSTLTVCLTKKSVFSLGDLPFQLFEDIFVIQSCRYFSYSKKCISRIFPRETCNPCDIWSEWWVDRSQSLFYFVPQEKRLIRRPPWGWKNMGESIFHQEIGSPQTRKRPNRYKHMPGAQGSLPELFSVHCPGRSSHFFRGHPPICSKGS